MLVVLVVFLCLRYLLSFWCCSNCGHIGVVVLIFVVVLVEHVFLVVFVEHVLLVVFDVLMELVFLVFVVLVEFVVITHVVLIVFCLYCSSELLF